MCVGWAARVCWRGEKVPMVEPLVEEDEEEEQGEAPCGSEVGPL